MSISSLVVVAEVMTVLLAVLMCVRIYGLYCQDVLLSNRRPPVPASPKPIQTGGSPNAILEDYIGDLLGAPHSPGESEMALGRPAPLLPDRNALPANDSLGSAAYQPITAFLSSRSDTGQS